MSDSFRKSLTLLTAAVLVPLFLCQCAGFQRKWSTALDAPRDGIEGPWEGTWLSTPSGHNGKLRCIVSKSKTNDGEYQFIYWATWAQVFSGSFESIHKIENSGAHFTLSGEKDLGILGGIYRFTGTMTPDSYKADYKSDIGDHGIFQMTRPPVTDATPDPAK